MGKHYGVVSVTICACLQVITAFAHEQGLVLAQKDVETREQ